MTLTVTVGVVFVSLEVSHKVPSGTNGGAAVFNDDTLSVTVRSAVTDDEE